MKDAKKSAEAAKKRMTDMEHQHGQNALEIEELKKEMIEFQTQLEKVIENIAAYQENIKDLAKTTGTLETRKYSHKHTPKHTQTRTHAYARTRTHANVHTHRQTHRHRHTDTHTDTHTQTDTHTYTHVNYLLSATFGVRVRWGNIPYVCGEVE